MSKTPIVALGDIAHFIRGINFKPDDVVPLGTEGSVACMRTKNVQSELDLTDVWAVAESFVRRNEQLLQAGDILVSSANSWNLVGKCSWIPELPWRASFGGFVSVLRANPAQVDARFLYQWFSWEHTQALLRSFGQKTTNISNLNIDRALALRLPCHPLEEQRRIAAILDQAETLRTQRRTALALLDSLTQSLFLDMFGEQADFPQQPLDQVCELITDGTHYTPTYVDTGVPFLSAKNVTSGYIDWESIKHIPESLHQELQRRVAPQKGDVLMAKNGTTGVAAIVDRDCIFDIYVSLALLRPSKDIDGVFLHAALNSPLSKKQFNAALKGIGVPNLHLKDIRGTKIPHPPLPLQQTFATRIASIEALKATHRDALAALDALFASLQQRAFAGQL